MHWPFKWGILLGFRQGIGTLLFYRVLGRQYEEGIRQGVSLAADRHLAFLHGLQQGGLGLRRGPVDLIRQDDVGEDRPLEKTELSFSPVGALMDDLRSRDVGGHEVRRELDPVEVQPQAIGQGSDQQGFRKARDSLDDAMPAGEDGDEQLLNNLVLSHDDLADLGPELVNALLHALDLTQVCFLCHQVIDPF